MNWGDEIGKAMANAIIGLVILSALVGVGLEHLFLWVWRHVSISVTT